MERRIFLTTLVAAALLTCFVTPAAAQQLDASEIENVLEGNTIEGTWGGDRYRQYFAADGTTIYVSAEGKRAEGRWRIDPEKDVYESWWISTGWTPYAMVDVPEDGYAWRNGERVEPFEVKQGRQLE